jgi:hypothetical protein
MDANNKALLNHLFQSPGSPLDRNLGELEKEEKSIKPLYLDLCLRVSLLKN